MTKNVAMKPVEYAVRKHRIARDASHEEMAGVESITFFQDTHTINELHGLPDPDPAGLKATMTFCLYRGKEKSSEMKLIDRFGEILESSWAWNIAECHTLKRRRYEYSGVEGGESGERVIKMLDKAEAQTILKNLHNYDIYAQLAFCRWISIQELMEIDSWEEIMAAHEEEENKLYLYTGNDNPFTMKLKPYEKFVQV